MNFKTHNRSTHLATAQNLGFQDIIGYHNSFKPLNNFVEDINLLYRKVKLHWNQSIEILFYMKTALMKYVLHRQIAVPQRKFPCG